MILHVNGRFYSQPITGVQRYGRELVAALDARASERGLPAPFTRVVAHLPAGVAMPTGLRAVEVRHHAPGRGHGWEQFVLPLATWDGLLFCLGNTAPIANLSRGHTVVTIHDLSFRYFAEAYSLPYRAWYRALTPLIIRRATRIITVSESERQAITRIYPGAAARLVAIPNGTSAVSAAPAATAAPTPHPYILHVGSLSRHKNSSGVLAGFDRLAGRRPELRLVVVGGTSAVFAPAGIAPREGVRDRVVFLGRVDDATLAAAYRGARVFVFPSFYEGAGLPPTEAMACGCPVVSADIPSLRERCGDAAIYCDPRDPGDIARAIERVLDDPALADDLRRRGARRAAQLTWTACAERTLALLAEAACA